MCGIAGYYNIGGSINPALVHQMTDVLVHRGPDAQGHYINDSIALGHRRLSIIDLDARATQPFYSQNKKWVMVFNGEIYNYIELRNFLQKSHGLAFHTSSDTEVLIEYWNIYGTDTLKQLNGMFAIAIFNTETNELFLARDHCGIKPLYFTEQDGLFYFASELKALKLIPQFNNTIDIDAVSLYLSAGCVPAPYTIYRGVKKLLPGHYIHCAGQQIKMHSFYSATSTLTAEVVSNEREAKAELQGLLQSSVQMQMRCDVPFGIFLSGGVDSSLIAALAVNHSPHSIATFSIGFSESTHDESRYALQVSQALKTNHHPFTVSYKDAMALASRIPHLYDEPFADPSAIPTYMVSELARKHVTIALSGDGGDELFFGYGSHKWAARLATPTWQVGQALLAKPLRLMPSRYKRIGELLTMRKGDERHSHIFSQEQYYFSSSQAATMVASDITFKTLMLQKAMETKSSARKLSAMEKQALLDFYLYLPDDLLTKTDRVSMYHSLEVRVPLLDYRIANFALNLHHTLKIKNGVQKYLLKECLYELLPASFFNRPKQGFSIPLAKWLKGDLAYLIDNHLNSTAIIKFGVLNNDRVQILVKKFRGGNDDYLFQRLWNLIILQQWLAHNN